MSKDNSDSAFPVPAVAETEYSKFREGSCGLTKREWFAGMALQGLCNARCNLMGQKEWQLATAKEAYNMADAMLEASNG